MAVKKIKELTLEDRLKKSYTQLIDLNQSLKDISEVYYIGYNNVILMKSIVPFIEKVIFLNEAEYASYFRGCMILPNKLFIFKKSAKKTKLIFTLTKDKIYIGQNDDDDLNITINQIFKDSPENRQNEALYTQSSVVPQMYSRYFTIAQDIDFNTLEYYKFSPEEIDDIVGCSKIDYNRDGVNFIITKNLFLNLKKDDTLSIAHIPDRSDAPTKKYLLFKHSNACYVDYTLVACLNTKEHA